METFTEKFIMDNLNCFMELPDFYLIDNKQFIREIIDKENNMNPITLIMSFFATPDCKSEIEDRTVAKKIFGDLYPKDNIEKRDVINSFWRIFVCQLVIWSNKICKEDKNKEFWSNLDSKWCSPIFGFGKTTELKYATYKGLCDISKECYVKKASDKENLQNKVLTAFTCDKDNEKIKLFASLTHCVANFMPCPEPPYNQAKGGLDEVRDFFPLMIDYIQGQMDLIIQKNESDEVVVNEKFNIKVSDIKNWHKWFIDNRKKYFLEEYYYIKNENNNVIIKGIPLFKGQSLENPLPYDDESKLNECFGNILRITRYRALKMAAKIQTYA